MQHRGVLVVLVAGALGAGLAFVGCSSDDDPDATGTAGPASSAPSSASSGAAGSSSSSGATGGAGAQGGGGAGASAGGGGSGGAMPAETNCSNGVDDDKDGDTDCEDADCAMDPACPLGATCAAAAPALVSNDGDTTGKTTLFAASCTGDEQAPEVVYSYLPPSNGVLQLKLTSLVDLGLYARSTCADPATEIGCSDGLDEEDLDVPVLANSPVAVFVDGHSPVDFGTFTLLANFAATTEVEPNDTSAQANLYAATYTGTIYPAGDADVVQVVVPPGTTQIIAETVDLGSGACAKNLLDSAVEILGTDGTTSLVLDDDGGDGFCGKATAAVSAPGTYFVRVTAGPVNPRFVFGYELDVSLM